MDANFKAVFVKLPIGTFGDDDSDGLLFRVDTIIAVRGYPDHTAVYLAGSEIPWRIALKPEEIFTILARIGRIAILPVDGEIVTFTSLPGGSDNGQ